MDIVAGPEVEPWLTAALAGAFGAFCVNQQFWESKKACLFLGKLAGEARDIWGGGSCHFYPDPSKIDGAAEWCSAEPGRFGDSPDTPDREVYSFG